MKEQPMHDFMSDSPTPITGWLTFAAAPCSPDGASVSAPHARDVDSHWKTSRKISTVAGDVWALPAGYVAHVLETTDFHFFLRYGKPVVLLTRENDGRQGSFEVCGVKGGLPLTETVETVRKLRELGAPESVVAPLLPGTTTPSPHATISDEWIRFSNIPHRESEDGLIITGDLTLRGHCLIRRFGGEPAPCFEGIVALEGVLTMEDCLLGELGSLRRVGKLVTRGETRFQKNGPLFHAN